MATDAPALSNQEIAVLELSTKGYNYDEVARLLNLSGHTVKTYVKRIYRKLNVSSKSEASYEARKLGLIRG
jgi:DNA-binding CsgD family transcriptional regulator